MYLEHVELFVGLDADTLRALREAARPRVYPAGSIVVNQGDEGHSLFIVQSGRLKVYLIDEQGREVTLSLLEPGDYFGELALIDQEPRSASVQALERSELTQITRSTFQGLMDAHESCRQAVLRNLARQVRTLTESVRLMALVDVFGRMSKLFDSLAVERDGKWVIEQRLTQQDIANFVGASREMVNRILRELVSGGYISMEHQQIQLLKRLPARW